MKTFVVCPMCHKGHETKDGVILCIIERLKELERVMEVLRGEKEIKFELTHIGRYSEGNEDH